MYTAFNSGCKTHQVRMCLVYERVTYLLFFVLRFLVNRNMLIIPTVVHSFI